MEGQPEPGEHCQRLPGLQCDRGGHEVGRFLEGTPVQRCPGMINTFFFYFPKMPTIIRYFSDEH